MKIEEFLKEIEKLGIPYTDEMLQQLESYCDYLLEYNLHTNLTAIRDKESVYLKHFYDSLTLVKAICLNEITTIVDIGSGAGFPGIVLKIFFPHLEMTLVDSNNKKTKFLESLVEKLRLINIKILNVRVEDFAKRHLNEFDLVTARAVANLRVLTEISVPLVKVNGYFVAMKGNAREELLESQETISLMGCEVLDIQRFNLYRDEMERTLIKILKIRETKFLELRSYEKIVKNKLQKKDN